MAVFMLDAFHVAVKSVVQTLLNEDVIYRFNTRRKGVSRQL